MAYSEKVMDHFQHPRNVGEIEDASGVGTVGNAKCGDIMRIFLDIDDETHIIKDCKFKTFGCGAAVATSSMATEMVKEFFYAVSYSAAMNLHIKVLSGGNSHHVAEAMFKSFAKALDAATQYDSRITDVLSTKGSL